MKLGSPVTEIQIYVTLKERVWLEDHYVSTDGNLLVERHVRKVLGVPQRASHFFQNCIFSDPEDISFVSLTIINQSCALSSW